MKTNWKKFKLFKILKQLLKIRLIFIKAQKKTVKYQRNPKTEITMTEKAKVSLFFFDLQFYMTMPLRGW